MAKPPLKWTYHLCQYVVDLSGNCCTAVLINIFVRKPAKFKLKLVLCFMNMNICGQFVCTIQCLTTLQCYFSCDNQMKSNQNTGHPSVCHFIKSIKVSACLRHGSLRRGCRLPALYASVILHIHTFSAMLSQDVTEISIQSRVHQC